MSYRVGIVAAPTSPEVIRDLAARMPLWVVKNDDNLATVEGLWQTRRTTDLEPGVTLYSAPQRLETREDWLSLLDMIELHHGEYSYNPPVDELEVIGASASAPVRSALSE